VNTSTKLVGLLWACFILILIQPAQSREFQKFVQIPVGEGQTLEQVRRLGLTRLVSEASQESRQYVEGQIVLNDCGLRQTVLQITPSFQKVNVTESKFVTKEDGLFYQVTATVDLDEAGLNSDVQRMQSGRTHPSGCAASTPARPSLPIGHAKPQEWFDRPTLLY